MIGDEVGSSAGDSLAQLVVDIWSVEIIRKGVAITVEIPHHVRAVIYKLDR
jgi:hypothetical protein